MFWPSGTSPKTPLVYTMPPSPSSSRGYVYPPIGIRTTNEASNHSRVALPVAHVSAILHCALAEGQSSSGMGRPIGGEYSPKENTYETDGAQYKLHILTLTGDHLATFAPRPDPGFGIRTVAWHPTGAFIAVGGWDDKVRLRSLPSFPPAHRYHRFTY